MFESEQEIVTQPVILIIDDKEEDVSKMQQALESPYKIVTATTVNDGLRLAKSLPQLDLIILETLVAGQSGYDICRLLKQTKETSDIPVVFLSNDDNQVNEENGLIAGAVDFIRRPLSTMNTILRRIHNAVQLKMCMDSLRRKSYIDDLTQIPNRASMQRALRGAWDIAEKTHYPLSVLMIDVDHFKIYNDRFGHVAGDVCLKQVACTLRSGLSRLGDEVFRYGGEEFVVILINTTMVSALLVGERLCRLVEDKVRNPDGDPVTVSIGCATAADSLYGTLTCSHVNLLIRADKELYQAKAGGRNRIYPKI